MHILYYTNLTFSKGRSRGSLGSQDHLLKHIREQKISKKHTKIPYFIPFQPTTNYTYYIAGGSGKHHIYLHF